MGDCREWKTSEATRYREAVASGPRATAPDAVRAGFGQLEQLEEADTGRRSAGVMVFAGVLILLAALLAGLLAADTARAQTFSGIEFPQGASSFADEVITLDRGDPRAQAGEPENALGPPDGADVSIGNGGSITVRFNDNVLTGSGDARSDLYVFEGGGQTELTDIFVSEDGQNFTLVGRTSGQTGAAGGVDIDDDGFGPGSEIRFVRVVDVVDDTPNQGPPRNGPDIESIGAIASEPAEPPPPVDVPTDPEEPVAPQEPVFPEEPTTMEEPTPAPEEPAVPEESAPAAPEQSQEVNQSNDQSGTATGGGSVVNNASNIVQQCQSGQSSTLSPVQCEQVVNLVQSGESAEQAVGQVVDQDQSVTGVQYQYADETPVEETPEAPAPEAPEVQEAPEAEAPVVEAPVVEAPVVEEKVVEEKVVEKVVEAGGTQEQADAAASASASAAAEAEADAEAAAEAAAVAAAEAGASEDVAEAAAEGVVSAETTEVAEVAEDEGSAISVLPDTGGASLFTLGAGALLLAGGLLARRIIR